MRARGWTVLQPSTLFVTVHNELSQIPEEYTREKDDQNASEMPKTSEHLTEEPFLLAAESPVATEHVELETPQAQPFQDMLSFEGDLPALTHLPYLSYAGELINSSVHADLAEKDATHKRVVANPKIAVDLFCLPGVEIDFDMSSEDGEIETAHEVIAETAGP
ncbi:hypothetical protein LTR53_000032 [Teratosphaeriaceae sp. CCFEE 6253]|nr:hypothetical protein LTR53_000032 [Teratosphaeriaceae sp. CCFEE 6253]